MSQSVVTKLGSYWGCLIRLLQANPSLHVTSKMNDAATLGASAKVSLSRFIRILVALKKIVRRILYVLSLKVVFTLSILKFVLSWARSFLRTILRCRGRATRSIEHCAIQYQVVFIPGLMTKGDEGDESLIVASGLSPFGSSHDRAVELYYFLKGGTVDYGLKHSKKFGHKRYGMTFPGIHREWGSDHPVIFIAHSHGGNTARTLQNLIRSGFFAEIPAGVSAPWIRAIVCIASPLNGCRLLYSLGMPPRSKCETHITADGVERGQQLGPWWSLVRFGQTLGYVAHWTTGDFPFFLRNVYDWGFRSWPRLTARTSGLRGLVRILKAEHAVQNTDDTAG